MKNVDPFPCSLSAQIDPPCDWTIFRLMASPSPVLDSPAVPRTLSFANGWKSLSSSFFGIPCPLSFTATVIDPSVSFADTRTSELGCENFIALLMRLSRSCLIRLSSTLIAGRFLSTSERISICFPRASVGVCRVMRRFAF